MDQPFAAAFEHILRDGWVQHCEYLDSIDSTNDYLKRAWDEEALNNVPRLVVARNQTAGRGRGKNRWWSPSGVLAFSLLVKHPLDEVNHERLPQLSLVTAIAVANVLDGLLASPSQLKWPNDVYVEGKKICGILVESAQKSRQLISVVGIGINVDVDWSQAPEEVRNLATSMDRHAMRRPTLDDVLAQCVVSLGQGFDEWKRDQGYIEKHFPPRCYLSGKFVEVESNGNMVRGKCCGISPIGELSLENEMGHRHVIRAGVIRSIQSL
jgi:BirA family biotin operon repressor/biotin-[acetyl-CoA-carboxylase] ligase